MVIDSATLGILGLRPDGYTPGALRIFFPARGPQEQEALPSDAFSELPTTRRQRYLLDATVDLLDLAREGDDLAVDVLCERVIPPLERWATGRLPARARDLVETGDIVQETVLKALRSLDRFESQREGALLAYLRTAIMNRVRDEARRVARRPDAVEIDERHASAEPSALESLIGRESIRIYEQSLERLRPADREAVIARLELGMSFDEVANALGKSSANTARMTVNRAILRLAEEMRRVQ